MATLGYNIYLTAAAKATPAGTQKRFIGVTQDDFTIANTLKESITKDNAGVKKVAAGNQTITFKVSGVLGMSDSGTTYNDGDTLIALALAKTELDITYLRSDGSSYEGSAFIMNYSESSSADPDTETTYTLDLQVNGTLTEA